MSKSIMAAKFQNMGAADRTEIERMAQYGRAEDDIAYASRHLAEFLGEDSF